MWVEVHLGKVLAIDSIELNHPNVISKAATHADSKVETKNKFRKAKEENPKGNFAKTNCCPCRRISGLDPGI